MRRELAEETGLKISVDRVLGVCPLELVPGAWLDVVAYDCLLPADEAPERIDPSPEHTSVALLDPGTLRDDELPAAYKQLIARQ